MNTTMADGASERLDAQIADALFGQPGMSKLDVANQLRLLRGKGGPLLCGSCYGLGVIGYTSGQTPEQFEQGEFPCPECAQPSLADQGDGLLPCPFCGNSAEFVPYKNNGLTVKCKSMGCIQRHQRTLRYGIEWLRTSMTEHWNARALAARPPVGAAVKDSLTVGGGQAVAWMTHHDEPMLFPTAAEAAAYCEDDEQPVPLFRSPAQAADLGQVREALQAAARSLRTIAESTKDTEFLETAGEIRAYAGSRANCAEQALMDGKAVQP